MLKIAKLAGAAALAFAASFAANATTVNLSAADYNQWQAFDVDDFAGPTFSTAWIDGHTEAGSTRYAGNGSLLGFSFTFAAPAKLWIVDSGFAGDRFSVSDNGISLGLTSVPVNTFDSFSLGASQADFNQAVSDGRFITAVFDLAAGTHVITGNLETTTAPFNATVGGLMITPVPEPETYGMLLAGLALIGAIARRRG